MMMLSDWSYVNEEGNSGIQNYGTDKTFASHSLGTLNVTMSQCQATSAVETDV
jgi:hypothetical protein